MADPADLKFYNASYRNEADKTASSTPGWSVPVVEPNTIAAYDAGGNPISVDQFWDGLGYLPPVTPGSDAAVAEAEVMTFWEQLADYAGIADLGAPIEWWPGLELYKSPEPGSRFLEDFGTGLGPDPQLFRQGWEPTDAASTFSFFDEQTGESQNIWVRYDPSRAAQQFFAMSASERQEYNTMMAEANMIDGSFKGLSDYSLEGAQAFADLLRYANYMGKPVKTVLSDVASRIKAAGGGSGRGSGPVVKVEIPDYDSMLADAKEMLKAKLGGREPKDWEMKLIADRMQREYGRWADAKQRTAYGGNGVYEVPDPVANTKTFLEDKYADEISRISDVGETRMNNQMLLNAATKGFNIMGGFNG